MSSSLQRITSIVANTTKYKSQDLIQNIMATFYTCAWYSLHNLQYNTHLTFCLGHARGSHISLKNLSQRDWLHTFCYQWGRFFAKTRISLLTSGAHQRILVVKCFRRDAECSLPSNAGVENTHCFTSTLPCVFMAWCSSTGRKLILHIHLHAPIVLLSPVIAYFMGTQNTAYEDIE